MDKINKSQKYIIAPLLIISLVVFNFPILPVLAEEGSSGTTESGGVVLENQPTQEITQPSGEGVSEETNSENGAPAQDNSQIATGDVEGQLNVENEVNSNAAETYQNEGQEEGQIEGQTQEQEGGQELEQEEPNNENECSCQEECEENCECDCKTTVINQNEAEVENNVKQEGETGENKAESDKDDAVIDTGDVNLVVGVVNTVNTNLTDSELSQSLLNIFEELDRDIDLTDELDGTNPPQEGCQSETNECLDVINKNDGEIENNVLIDGSSGGNTADSEDGNAVIKTGDVNVVTDIFNLLNTNLVGSNWQNFIINIFDDWTGDLILPGKDKIQQFLNTSQDIGCGADCGSSTINSNKGQIENEVYVNTNTGGNIAIGKFSIIRTGNARAITNVVNIANTNMTGGSWFFIAINDFGGWKGNIYSLPPGLGMTEDSNGIKIYNLDPEDLDNPASPSNESFDVVNDNAGLIKNSVIVNVETGDNSTIATEGQAAIETGNANAFTNIVNVLNSNITGSNWLLGMVNVFGTWKGDLSFGRPDLWIGESAATSSNPATPGGTITYTLTYTNNGDADATGVTLFDNFDEKYLTIADSGGGVIINNPGEIKWDIGTVPVGGSASVSYTAQIDTGMPYGTTSLTNQSTISGLEDDWNNGDNTETLSVDVDGGMPSFGGGPSSGARGEIFKITKTNNNKDGLAYAGSNVDYKIVLYNDSLAHLYNVVVDDVVVNENTSKVYNTHYWDLGEVFPNEEITIDYTVAFGTEVPAGLYKNTAKAEGMDISGNSVWSAEVSNVIEIRVSEVPSESEEESPKGINLEEIERMLKEISAKVEVIREEISRNTPPVSKISSEIGEQNSGQEVLGSLLPEANAQELNLSQPETQGLNRFLAAIDGLLSGRSLIVWLILSFFLLLLLFLDKRRRQEI